MPVVGDGPASLCATPSATLTAALCRQPSYKETPEEAKVCPPQVGLVTWLVLDSYRGVALLELGVLCGLMAWWACLSFGPRVSGPRVGAYRCDASLGEIAVGLVVQGLAY